MGVKLTKGQIKERIKHFINPAVRGTDILEWINSKGVVCANDISKAFKLPKGEANVRLCKLRYGRYIEEVTGDFARENIKMVLQFRRSERNKENRGGRYHKFYVITQRGVKKLKLLNNINWVERR
jgi:hypothetical protein